MKVTIVIPVFVCAFSAASAQMKQPAAVPVIIKTPVTKLPQATLLSVNEKGEIYALPQDNMPCLVPHQSLSYKVPNGSRFSLPNNNMPNAMRVQPVIPSR